MKCLLAALLFVIAGCSQAGGSSSLSPASSLGPEPSADATALHVRDFTLDPKAISIGGSAVLAVTNDGPTIHNVTIRDSSGALLAATKDLKKGQSETISVQISPGTYVMYCSLPGHESLGIKGTLTVTR